MNLIFEKTSYRPTETITGFAPSSGSIRVFHLGTPIKEVACTDEFDLGIFPEGSYSITWSGNGGEKQSSAFEVLQEPWSRLRYGFISEFSDSVEVDNYVDWAKKLHLSLIHI